MPSGLAGVDPPASAVATPARHVVARDLDDMCGTLHEELSRLSSNRVLIAGGAGFLGYYLVQTALHWNRQAGGRPIRITVLDSYARGIPAWLQELKRDADLTLVGRDVASLSPRSIGDFQYIIHAASIASPTYYRKHPIETMDANVNGLRSLLEYARHQREQGQPVTALLFLSSSEIYGDPPPEHIPTMETYRGNVSCTGPRACYDEAKRYGETLAVNYARHVGIPVTVARPFNNYGPGLKVTDGRALPDFARDVLAGRDVVMLSDGTARRTFCYVADAVIGYYKVLVKGRPGEAYNIGAEGPEVSIRELAEMVAFEARELFGYRGQVVQRQSSDTDYLADNPARRCPAIAKARHDLGYQPAVSLGEGLRRSLIWYAEHREASEA